MSTTPLADWARPARDLLDGWNTPSPPPSIIAGPPIPMFEPFFVAITTSQVPEQRYVPGEAVA
ncbi:MAG: hypothetical protein R2715_22810 [Ilumatobacteraceae bacterium]